MRVARCCQPHAFQTRVARGIPGGSVVALLAEASGCVPCSCKKHRSHLQSQSRSAARGPNEQLPGRRLCRANSSEGMVQPLAGHCREFPARCAMLRGVRWIAALRAPRAASGGGQSIVQPETVPGAGRAQLAECAARWPTACEARATAHFAIRARSVHCELQACTARLKTQGNAQGTGPTAA